MKAALTRAAILIITQAKLNVRRKRIVDTGRLLNSLRYEFIRPTEGSDIRLLIGSFGVPYAAIHEFGGVFTDRQRRAMFANLRDQGKLGNSKNKGVIKGKRFGKRPYLTPAYRKHRERVIDLITQAFEEQ